MRIAGRNIPMAALQQINRGKPLLQMQKFVYLRKQIEFLT
jgi:hypothetical protein